MSDGRHPSTGRARLIALLALVLAGAALWPVLRFAPLPLAGEAPPDAFARAAGVVHVHTTFSDGGGTPAEVVAAARSAGLDFVVITDHNNLDAKRFEGYRSGVLVSVGSELSTTAGHILGLGVPDPVFRFSGDAADVLEDIRDLGGTAFAAHPLSPRADLRFTGFELPGPWGLELLNGDSEWRAAGLRLALTAALYGLNPRYALLRALSPPDATLRRWDALLARRAVPGIVGADAHSRVPIGGRASVRFPSYAALFSLAQNHVLLESRLSLDATHFADDERKLLAALRDGRSYVGLDGLAPAGFFFFEIESEAGRWTMGQTAPLGPGLLLRAGGRVPAGTRLRLLRDGRTLSEATNHLELPVPGAGVYRVEARVGGFEAPWIVSNPIYVLEEPARAERDRAARWPEPVPAPPAAQALDAFEGSTALQANADSLSSADPVVLDREAGPRGRGAARLRFRLGQPGPGHAHTFCALVDRTPRDLRGHSGLVFAIRADAVYRIFVQVRDSNPASADEGTEWWFASVRTTPEWRRVALPFSQLRTINPRSDGRLDLDKVRGLVFVLDQGAVKPGTSGTIWIAELGVY